VAAVLVALGGSSPAQATFPGANGLIVFSGVDSSTQTVQLYGLRADGTGLTQITSTTSGVWNECPSWAADGRTIFFDSANRAVNGTPRIFRVQSDGSGLRRADQARAPAHFCPSVNRRTSRIAALQYSTQGSSAIVTMTSNGGQRRIVARAGARQNTYGPKYAPDGARIAFYRVTFAPRGGYSRSDILVVNAAGRTTNITAKSGSLYFSPDWAPDGQSIVALRGRSFGQIVRMTPNGKNVRVLRTVRGATVTSPTFSPDGSKIAYMQCVGDCGDPELQGQGSIWVMDADGSNAVQIVGPSAAGVRPGGTLDWGVAAP
jgi:TolB protein